MLNKQRVANPAHFITVCQNTHYGVFSIKSTQPEKLIDSKEFFGKCSNFLKPFDRIQVIKQDELIILEYIVRDIDPHNLTVETIKLSKLDLLNGTYIQYSNSVQRTNYGKENKVFQTKLASEKEGKEENGN